MTSRRCELIQECDQSIEIIWCHPLRVSVRDETENQVERRAGSLWMGSCGPKGGEHDVPLSLRTVGIVERYISRYHRIDHT